MTAFALALTGTLAAVALLALCICRSGRPEPYDSAQDSATNDGMPDHRER